LRCSRCSMLLLQCLAVGLYNTIPLTSKLPHSSCVPAKPLELRRWYLIMLLLQSMAPSGYSRSPQAPKLWMQQISSCVPAKPLELRRLYLIMLLLQSMAPSGYSHNFQAPKLWMQQISTDLEMCSDETIGATMFSL